MSAEPTQENILNSLFHALRRAQEANYSTAAATTVIFYDICFTFSDEARFIWQAKWSLPKITYLLARYYGFIYLVIILGFGTNTKLTPELCRGYFYFYSYGGVLFTNSITAVILVIRLYALYERSRKVLFFCISLSLAEFILELSVTQIAARTAANSAEVAPLELPWPGCVCDTLPTTKLTLIGWIPASVTATIFFGFMIVKFKEALKNQSRAPELRFQQQVATLSPTLVVFVRDGALYFFLIFAILVVSSVITVVKNGDLSSAVTPAWLTAMNSLSGSHLILDLRKAVNRGVISTFRASNDMPLAFMRPSTPENAGSQVTNFASSPRR